ncbi:MAG: alpha/beta hydrolase [Hamadaea sp.]|nr:alpha/beta hydrolase [Hamadaea sp.]
MRIRAALATAVSTLVLAASVLLGPAPAGAVGYQRGPDPTTTSIDAAQGTFAIAQLAVANAATPGFGAATIYYPTSTAEGTFGGVAMVPVMGHSMGGGGALEAAKARPSLRAAVPLAPWNSDRTWPEVVSPTLIVGAEKDTTAPVASYAVPMYTGMTAAPEKAYVELNDAGHSATSTPNTTAARYSLSWLKRFVDDDSRYSQFLCPGPTPSQTGPVSAYENTCPI